jgi:hypothetical protein
LLKIGSLFIRDAELEARLRYLHTPDFFARATAGPWITFVGAGSTAAFPDNSAVGENKTS